MRISHAFIEKKKVKNSDQTCDCVHVCKCVCACVRVGHLRGGGVVSRPAPTTAGNLLTSPPSPAPAPAPAPAPPAVPVSVEPRRGKPPDDDGREDVTAGRVTDSAAARGNVADRSALLLVETSKSEDAAKFRDAGGGIAMGLPASTTQHNTSHRDTTA